MTDPTPPPSGPPRPEFHRRLVRLRRIWRTAAGATAIMMVLSRPFLDAEFRELGLAVHILFAAIAALVVIEIGFLYETLLRMAARAKNPPTDDALRSGVSALLANDRFAAQARFEEMLACDPRDVEAAFYLGLVLKEHGDRRGAARALKRALRIDVRRKWTGEIRELLAPLN